MAETRVRLTQTDLDADSNVLTGLSNGVAASDAVNKSQLDAAVAGVLTTANMVFNEVPTGAIDNTNTIFTLAFTPVVGTERVHQNGLRLKSGVGNDYTISGVTITFASAPRLKGGMPDRLLVDYIK